jgi:hypothetical protein
MSFRPSSTAESGIDARGERLLDANRTIGQPRKLAMIRKITKRLKLRARRLGERVERSRRDRLLPEGYWLGLLFLKLFERVYAPLTAGLLRPIAADARSRNKGAIDSTGFTNASDRPGCPLVCRRPEVRP